jgi:hypothetical protein
MKKNMGNPDRIVRLILAAIMAVLFFTNTVTGVFGIIFAGARHCICFDQPDKFLPVVHPGGIKYMQN